MFFIKVKKLIFMFLCANQCF